MRGVWALIRGVTALLILAAIVAQLTVSVGLWSEDPAAEVGFLVVGFWSFFTIESNLLAVIALALGAAILVLRRGGDPRWFALFRLSVTTYMTVTGIVYNVLLRGIELPQGATVPWSNEVLHVVGPLVLLLDWLLAPGRQRMRWSAIGIVIAFPIVWVVYTLLRGAVAVDARTGEGWYPYPFLNPAQPGGYGAVAGYVVVIALVIALMGLGAIAVSRRFGTSAEVGGDLSSEPSARAAS